MTRLKNCGDHITLIQLKIQVRIVLILLENTIFPGFLNVGTSCPFRPVHTLIQNEVFFTHVLYQEQSRRVTPSLSVINKRLVILTSFNNKLDRNLNHHEKPVAYTPFIIYIHIYFARVVHVTRHLPKRILVARSDVGATIFVP